MKFSELVELRERLKTEYNTDSISGALFNLTGIIDGIKNSTPASDLKQELESLNQDLGRIESVVKFNNDRYQSLLDIVNSRISQESAKFFTENYSLELKYDAVENIRKVRVMPISDAVRKDVITRIQLYSNWAYPALEIGCRDGDWTQYLIAADPLYIVDQYKEFIYASSMQFNEAYRNRIRTYLIDKHDLSPLPENQMGFVFCWNFLNYCSLDTIKEYLKEVKRILRPGGVFLFSYNDGDRPGCAGMAENFFMSYMPKSLLIPLCESLGFEIVDDQARDRTVSWLEIRKPGELKTNKAHQVLGEIKAIID